MITVVLKQGVLGAKQPLQISLSFHLFTSQLSYVHFSELVCWYEDAVSSLRVISWLSTLHYFGNYVCKLIDIEILRYEIKHELHDTFRPIKCI